MLGKIMREKFLWVVTAVSFIFAFSLVSISDARSRPKKMFEDFFEDEGRKMLLKGTAYKWVFMMKVFSAGLYLDEQASVKDVMSDVAKKIEVYYYYPIPGKKLAQYTKNQMKLNLTKKEFAEVKDRLSTLDRYFVDLKPGDRYALSYSPGKGTKFIYNGKEVGIIEGADFSKGIFAVWVGDKPMDRHVKNEILGIKNNKFDRQSLLSGKNAIKQYANHNSEEPLFLSMDKPF